MKKYRLAIAAAIAALIASQSAGAVTFAKPGTLRRAVQAYYLQNDYVQAAVFIDVCHGELTDTKASRVHLNSRDAKRYDRVRELLALVFDRTAGTDSALEAVANDFCDAAENR